MKRVRNYLPAIIIWIISFSYESMIFTGERGEHILDYVLCRIILLGVLCLVNRFILNAFVDKESKERKIMRYALPYFVILLIILIVTGAQFTVDEKDIFAAAIEFKDFSDWFNYYTGYYFIISLMLIPFRIAPLLIKIILQALTAGYCISRSKQYWKSNCVFLLYILFCLWPVLELGISAHRLPTYGMLYLFFFVKLFYDYRENKALDMKTLIGISACGSILMGWRSEGIYLILLLPIALFFAYHLKSRRDIIVMLLVSAGIQVIFYIPQYMDTLMGNESYVEDRMGPFYYYAIPNMIGEGLDRQKNAEALEVINEYLDIDIIDDINKEYGEARYADAMIFYSHDRKAVKENIPYEEFVKASQKLMIENPGVFLKTRLHAWNYASIKYFPTSKSNPMQWLRFFTHELYIPTAMILYVCILALVKKKWFSFFFTGGVLANTVIVVALMPATYFKYFYIIYLIGYFYVFEYIANTYVRKKSCVEDNKFENEI